MQQPNPSLSDDLQQVVERFTQWRRTRIGRSRIPEELWQLACQVARTHGVSKTSAALKVSYPRLKRRLLASGSVGKPRDGKRARKPSGQAAFVELPPLAAPVAMECEIEFEDARGARLLLRWKGLDAPDLTTLGQVFWSR